MAKFQVIAEENVCESWSLRVLLRGNREPSLCHHDHHVRAGKLLQQSNDAEEVGNGQVVTGGASQVEQVLCEESVLRNTCSCREQQVGSFLLNSRVKYTRKEAETHLFAHVEESSGE